MTNPLTTSAEVAIHNHEDIDTLAVKTIRCLSADMVQAANSGHPGAPMGCAAMAHALFGYVMNYSASNPNWWARDRFVLSNGHACALLYSMLHLTGYEAVSMDQLKKFRQLGSITPGHPEAGLTPGVEVSTGPLGQGISNAVGMALAQSMLAARYGENLFDNYTYVICGDGCLQEGISYEACGLAGHLGLGRLIVLYDDNEITIDGKTELSFTENVRLRFEAQGWEVLEVSEGSHNVSAILHAISSAKISKHKPSLIKVRTTIGVDSAKAGSEKCHGSPLGAEEIKRIKLAYGFDPNVNFHVPSEVVEFYKKTAFSRGIAAQTRWNKLFSELSPETQSEISNRFDASSELFEFDRLKSWMNSAVQFDPSQAKATRQYSGDVLAAMVKSFGSIVGGSADLTESTVTNKANLAPYTKTHPENRFIHFGVREHAMAAISNGLAAYGGMLPFCATFANFIGYCWGSVRLSALSHHKVLYIATHDSIDLGEDGPTHQPIEILPLLRGTPNMQTLRPADGTETKAAYLAHFRDENKGPSVMLLSRGAVPTLVNSSIEGALKGAYILEDFTDCGSSCSKGKIILAGSGSEVALLVDAAKLLRETSNVRVVSMPSWDLFARQSEEYRKTVFLANVPVLYVEAASCDGFAKFGGNHSIVKTIGMTTFGASAPAKDLKKEFGFTIDNIVNTSKQMMSL